MRLVCDGCQQAPSLRYFQHQGNKNRSCACACGPWTIEHNRLLIDPQPVMRASSLLIVRDTALAGVSVAVLPRSIIGSRLESGELVQWGPAGKIVELWARHTSRRLPSAKVRAFVDFMRDQYPDGELVLQG